MTAGKAVVIGWLQVPSKAVPSRWPEHEVSGQLCGEGICRFPALLQVSPLRPHAEHELGLAGEGPWLLEEKIRIPFSRVPRVKGRHARLQFKPVLDGGTLCREVWSERSSASAEVPIGRRSHFQDGDRVVRICGSLGCGGGRIVLSHLPQGR